MSQSISTTRSGRPYQINMSTSGTATAARIKFSSHPYDNDINPATSEGIKLYKNATTELTSKLTLNESNVKAILAQLKKDAKNFRWGPIVNAVQVGSKADGTPIKKSILLHSSQIKDDDVQKQAVVTWKDYSVTYNTAVVPPEYDQRTIQDIDPENNQAHREVFFRRVRSTMISDRVLAYFPSQSAVKLTNNCKAYE